MPLSFTGFKNHLAVCLLVMCQLCAPGAFPAGPMWILYTVRLGGNGPGRCNNTRSESVLCRVGKQSVGFVVVSWGGHHHTW